MREVAEGVWQIPLMRRDLVNAYLLDDVLVDAGTRGMGRRLPRLLAGHRVAAHAITHAHPDHVGGSKAVCERLGVPFWAPAGEADDVEAGRGRSAGGPVPAPRFPAVPVARRLREGDEVAGFRVLFTPGHSPGHVAYWRQDDRVLVAGDVIFDLGLPTLRPGVREPPRLLTADPSLNRESIRRLAALGPRLTLVGHGPPVRGTAELAELVATLR